MDRYIPISGGGLGQTFYNPLYNTTLNTIDEEKYNDVTNNFGVDWTIIEGLRLKGSFSFTVTILSLQDIRILRITATRILTEEERILVRVERISAMMPVQY